MTGRLHPPEARKHKPIFAQQTNNVLQLEQAGWLMSKKAGKDHHQRGQWHLFVPSKSLYTPSLPAQGTSVFQPPVLDLVPALPVCSWSAAALFQKGTIRGASGSISAIWKEKVKMPCVVIFIAQGQRAHLTCIETPISPFWKRNVTYSKVREECRDIRLSSHRSVFGCAVTKHGEGCVYVVGGVCVYMCVGAGWHVWSIVSDNPRVTPAVTFLVASHWPLVYWGKLTPTSLGGANGDSRVGKSELLLSRVERGGGGGHYIFFVIKFQRDLLLFLLCSVSVAKTPRHAYSLSVRGEVNAVPATSQWHPSEQQ